MKENKVLSSAQKIMSIDSNNFPELLIANNEYIETLAQSNASEIKDMLENLLGENYLEFPFWARLIAFRILCLLEPEDIDLKKWAEGDISALGGPEWDNVIKW